MWPNPLFPADLVAFTEEILNGKLLSITGLLLSFLADSLNTYYDELVLQSASKLY